MNAAVTGNDLAVWTAAIAGGSAVIAGIVGTLGGAWATSRTLRANSQLARDQFLREKQSDAYLMAANYMVRVRAWANIAVDEAKGTTPRFSTKPEIWAGDEWFQMSAQLRVFGSLQARVHFDDMHEASSALYRLVLRYQARDPASHEEVDSAYQLVHFWAGRLGVILTAELGPLNDILKNSPEHWWHFRKKRSARKQLEALSRLVDSKEADRVTRYRDVKSHASSHIPKSTPPNETEA